MNSCNAAGDVSFVPQLSSSRRSSYSSGYSSEENSMPLLSSLIEDYVDSVFSTHAPSDEAIKLEDSIPMLTDADVSPTQDTPVFNMRILSSEDLRPVCKHPVPADLQAAILDSNPGVQFVSSQRHNLQLRLHGYLLNKKRGPRVTRNGRTINWRCVHAACRYTVTSYEGRLVTGHHNSEHNHAPQPPRALRSKLQDIQ
jgi:hypothetical protein